MWRKPWSIRASYFIKYWLEVSPEEQTRRLQSRIDDPRKIWKLSEMDLLSYSRWFDYSRARDDMFAATDTAWAPWWIVSSDDKKRARLNVISHLLGQIPYEPPEHRGSNFRIRQEPGGYREPNAPLHSHPDSVLRMLARLRSDQERLVALRPTRTTRRSETIPVRVPQPLSLRSPRPVAPRPRSDDV